MRRYHNSHLSFIDFLLNTVAVYAALFLLVIALIADPQPPQTKTVDVRAQVLIVMDWDPLSSDDMDLSLETPEPAKIVYNNPHAGAIASLDRDDLGLENDVFIDPATGQPHYLHLNRETISIRQLMPGEYTIDVTFYARKQSAETGKTSSGPQEVTVQIIGLDPYKEIITKSVMINDQGDTVTVLTFTVADGKVVAVDTAPEQNDFPHRDDTGMPQAGAPQP